MTNPSDDLLVTSEGVDEGSARSTDERPRPAGDPTGSSASGPSTGEQTPAPPVDMESDASRASRDQAGSGQQLQAGEG